MVITNDVITLIRVANGWIIQPGSGAIGGDFTHVATTPAELAKHVEKWASALIAPTK
jgi:hypothetical protein